MILFKLESDRIATESVEMPEQQIRSGTEGFPLLRGGR